MPFAFSTLGCPELTLSEAARLSVNTGYSGLELRSSPDGTVTRTADTAQRASWRQELGSHHVSCVSVASYLKLCDVSIDDDAFLSQATPELHLANSLGASWLRVFPGGPKGVPCPEYLEARASVRLRKLADLANFVGVTVAVETHDSHPTGRDVMRLLDKAERPAVAVIWDVLHTWLGDEAPSTTAEVLGERLAYIQVKDVPGRGDLTPVSLGRGVLPLKECVALAGEGRPDLWISWEYERRWHPEVPSLQDVAMAGREFLTTLTN